MSTTAAPSINHDRPGMCRLRVRGHLDERWAGWFAGLTITPEDDGATLLADQAALHGLLKRVRDLGLPLLSVDFAGPAPARPPADAP